jgi:FHA domain-containing protein
VVEVFVVSYSGVAAAGAPLMATFDVTGGTVGRGAGNLLTLPDPDRHLSRVQAKVVGMRGDAFEVSNLSRANSIFVGADELEPLQNTVARIGAELRMGLYVLGTRVAKANVVTGAPLKEPAAPLDAMVTPTGINAVPDPFADVLGVSSAGATHQRVAQPGAGSLSSTRAVNARASLPSSSTRIPDDFDLF